MISCSSKFVYLFSLVVSINFLSVVFYEMLSVQMINDRNVACPFKMLCHIIDYTTMFIVIDSLLAVLERRKDKKPIALDTKRIG